MSRSGITDGEIEMLISEGQGDPDLQRFVATLARPTGPPRDIEHMSSALAATARSTAPVSRGRGLRRITVLAGVGALVVALGGVAMAADGSAPGDPLYGLDRTLESLGIGNGGVDERIEEFDALLAHGQDEAGYAMLAEVIETADALESEKAQQHLELAATKTNPNAQASQEKVARLKEFIETNKGTGNIDGKEFGQEVAKIAKSNADDSTDTDQGEATDAQPGNSANAPGRQDDDRPDNSANAPGQQGDTASQSEPTDPSEPQEVEPNEQPGNSGNAPGQQGERGNSADAPGQQKDKDE